MKTFISILIVIIIIAAGIFFVVPMLKNMSKSNEQPEPASSASLYPHGDINQDKTANATDKFMIKGSLGCTSTQPCWNTVIGQTLSGNNPIYVHDLDLNKDNVIDQKDMDEVGK